MWFLVGGPWVVKWVWSDAHPTCLHNSNISSDLLSFFNSSTSIIMFLLYLVLVLFLGALQAHGENVDKGESGSGLLLFAFF